MDSNSEKPSAIPNPEKRISRRAFIRLSGAAAAGAGAAYVAYKLGLKDHGTSSVQIPEIPLPEFVSPAKHQNILVTLLKDSSSEELYPKGKVELMMEDARNYYRENSYGKINFSSEVMDWQTTSIPIDPTNLEGMAQLGNEVAESSGIETKPDSTRIYFIDRRGKKVDVGGRGEKKEPFNRVWIFAEFDSTDAKQIRHELGHSLGLGHVDFVSSKFVYGTPEFEQSLDDFTNNLSVDPAGGTADIMGRGDGHFCVANKVQMGWIKSDQIQTALGNTSCELDPVENNRGKTLGLRIPKVDTGDFYYIEYRQPTEIEKNVDEGLYFYIWDEKLGSNVKQFYIRPGHRYIKVGDEFYDKINGIRVKIVDQNGKAKLQVVFEPKKF